MNTIEISNLSHQFSADHKVLDSVSFRVPKGSIFGFLGRNGAGKTTTLRLLLGLLARQTGEVKVFGQDIAENRIGILKRVGSLIESPSFYAHLSANDNLKLLQLVYQCPISRVQEVLKTVGLQDTGSKRVKQFSLGMKQRLSIAMSLLHTPDLLVLDEPTNGLDPNGIIEMRELLMKLNREKGTTILISSHLLSEVEKLITDLAILEQGRLIFDGTYSDLKQKQASRSKIVIRTSGGSRAGQTAQKLGMEFAYVDDETLELDLVSDDAVARLNHALVKQNIGVFQIAKQTAQLEDIFINLINN